MQRLPSTPNLQRRTFLKSAAVATPLVLLPGSVIASADLRFDNALEKMSGPLKKIGQSLARKARGRMGPGGEAQLLLDEYLSGINKDAPQEIFKIAREGDNKARTVLGFMFDNGIGANRDVRRAINNFALAAYSEELALYNLGVMTLYGRGVSANTEKAIEHLVKVKRIPYAFVHLTTHALEQGYGEVALETARTGSKLNEPYATYLYARLLIEKGESTQGLQEMKNAASINVPEAITSMIYLYDNGIGAPVDHGMAIGWWIIERVLVYGDELEDAIESATRFDLKRRDYGVARRFSTKWLINRTPYEPFNYAKTLTYSQLSRR